MTVKSPCIGVCKENAEGICNGCYRTMQERSYWGTYTDKLQETTIKLCQLRQARGYADAIKP